VPHRIIWSWYTGCWWVGCYIWYSEEGIGWGHSLPRPLLSVPNVTTHPSMASVPICVLLYNGLLRCSFRLRCSSNVPIKQWLGPVVSFNCQIWAAHMWLLKCGYRSSDCVWSLCIRHLTHSLTTYLHSSSPCQPLTGLHVSVTTSSLSSTSTNDGINFTWLSVLLPW